MIVTQEMIDNVEQSIMDCLNGQSVSKGDRSITRVNFEQLVKYRDRLQKLFDQQNGNRRGFPAFNQGIVKI